MSPDYPLAPLRPRLLALALCAQVAACAHQGAGAPALPVERQSTQSGNAGTPGRSGRLAEAPAEDAGPGVPAGPPLPSGSGSGNEPFAFDDAEPDASRRRREPAAERPAPAAPAVLNPAAGGLGLKLDVEMVAPESSGADEDLPLYLDADRIEGVQGKQVDAIGDVVVRRRGLRLSADQLTYLIPENSVVATGNVRFRRTTDVMTGERATYNLGKDTGTVDNAGYKFGEFGARGRANRMVMRDRDRYRADRATYTNCDVGDDDWFLRVDRLDLDRLTDTGEAHSATLYFKGAPVLYTPWIDFPLSNRRKSGFLAPAIGTTNKSGFEFTLPYYWNIAPNLDYTLSTRVMAARGVQFGNEFRYLEPHSSGTIRAEILPDDKKDNGDTRWGYLIKHDQQFTPRLTGNLNVAGVSDDKYFVDLSDKIAATSITNLPREGSLNYNGDAWTVYGRIQTFQTLQDPQNPVTPPYKRVPQIVFRAAEQNVRGFDVNMYGEVVDFEQDNQVSAVRQVYYPTASYRFGDGFYYFVPQAGVNYTAYSYTNDGSGTVSRTLPVVTLDSGLNFSRQTSAFGQNYTQTLEPRVYYVYIPYKNQNDLPVFDTAVADFNLAQIFTWNRFGGYDRINNANQITLGATTRFLDDRTGTQRLTATLAQRYYFTDQQVDLGTDDNRASNSSDILFGLTGYVTHHWWLDLSQQFNQDDGNFQKFDVGMRYRPQPGKVFNMAYRYTRDQLENIDMAGQWPLARNWSGLGRVSYSIQDGSLVEGLAGLEYTSGCWAARFVAHSFVTSAQRSQAFFAQIELRGLSSVGLNPLKLLSQSIYGYERAAPGESASEDYFPGMDNE